MLNPMVAQGNGNGQDAKDMIFKAVKDRYEGLKGGRGTWESHWQEIADLQHPFDDNFVAQNETAGSEKMTFIYDSTGVHSNQLLSAGLFSMLTNPAQKWFELEVTDPAYARIREVQIWVKMISETMYYEINKPNAHFNTAMHELYLEYGAFGNGILFLTEGHDRKGLRFQALPLSETYLAEGSLGLMDALFRNYTRTVRQLVQRFGMDKVSEKVKKQHEEQKLDEKVHCAHAIVPPGDYGIPTQFPFLSVYIDIENKHVIDGNGFYELPFMAPRFYKNPWEQYGRGPGTTALPDVKMLQEVMRTTIRAAQKRTDPPLQAPDDGFLNPVRTTPGGINFYRAGTPDRIEPIMMGSDPGVGQEIINDLRERIRDIYFVDQLQLQEGPQMTATEVLQRTEEKLRLMGPLMGRLESELLGPMLGRVYGILSRQGKLAPPPEVLQQADFKVTYTSPIARAQEQTEAGGIMRALQVLEPFINMDPSVSDNFNGDELSKGVFKMFSVSPIYLREDEQIAATRKDRAKKAEDKMKAENVQKAGQGYESFTRAGENMQNIDQGGGNT